MKQGKFLFKVQWLTDCHFSLLKLTAKLKNVSLGLAISSTQKINEKYLMFGPGPASLERERLLSNEAI